MDERLAGGPDDAPIDSCTMQGGEVAVYEDCVVIERSGASMYEDKTIPMDEIRSVNYDGGLLTGHLQIVQQDLDPAEGGLLSKPVDENTLYFPRGTRSSVRRVRDAILERASGEG
jgi:hypothetical protein